jgi:Leucine-rich repeat (LRR) protein
MLQPELSGAKNMKDFNASQNSIPSSYYSWKRLERLDLDDNGFNGVIDKNYVSDMINMTYLSLHDNLLSGVIPPILSKLQNVQVVELNHNQLRGTLPSELSSLQLLRRLRVQGNQLVGSAPTLTLFSGEETLEYITDCGGTSTD